MPKTKPCSESTTLPATPNKGGSRKYVGIWNDIDECIFNDSRTVFLSGVIDSDTVLILTRMISYLLGRSKKKPINLHINTPGGAVTDGLALYDLLNGCQAPIHALATGMCMSMGVIILQAAAVRRATENTTFMLHEVGTMRFGGSLTQNAATQKETERLQRTLDDILMSRSGMSKRSAASFMKIQERYFGAEEALSHGLLDAII